MSIERVLPMIRAYHSGDKSGAVDFFAENPDLLPWAREEIQHLSVPLMRGSPPQVCRVSEAHRAALQRMVDEHDQHMKEKE